MCSAERLKYNKDSTKQISRVRDNGWSGAYFYSLAGGHGAGRIDHDVHPDRGKIDHVPEAVGVLGHGEQMRVAGVAVTRELVQPRRERLHGAGGGHGEHDSVVVVNAD